MPLYIDDHTVESIANSIQDWSDTDKLELIAVLANQVREDLLLSSEEEEEENIVNS